MKFGQLDNVNNSKANNISIPGTQKLVDKLRHQQKVELVTQNNIVHSVLYRLYSFSSLQDA